jgi:hypothetical protein
MIDHKQSQTSTTARTAVVATREEFDGIVGRLARVDVAQVDYWIGRDRILRK